MKLKYKKLKYNEMPHILVVDDDERIRNLLDRYLTEQGFMVTTAIDAKNARENLQYFEHDLVVLDVMMPGEDGMSLTKDLKLERPELPVLLLTALGESSSRIDGLEAGADDYLAKPFEPKELSLRINAILNRTGFKAKASKICFGNLVFNPEYRELKSDTDKITLTDTEALLLEVLIARNSEIISRQDLAKLTGNENNERTIDVQVTRLRKKIEQDPKQPRYLQTVRGKGYILRHGD